MLSTFVILTTQQVFDQDAQAMLSHSRRRISLEDWIWSLQAWLYLNAFHGQSRHGHTVFPLLNERLLVSSKIASDIFVGQSVLRKKNSCGFAFHFACVRPILQTEGT